MATQQVIFKVNEGEYGLDVAQVNAIETLTSVVPVPNAANHILGIMNLRGDVLPVFSLRTKFGLQEVPVNEQTKIIVTKSNGVTIAFKVDEVKEIIEMEKTQEVAETEEETENEEEIESQEIEQPEEISEEVISIEEE